MKNFSTLTARSLCASIIYGTAPVVWPFRREPEAPQESETAPETDAMPAPLDLIEAATIDDILAAAERAAMHRQYIQELQIERAELSIHKQRLVSFSFDMVWRNKALAEELRRVEARLTELDEMLIFEDLESSTPHWDDFDADLPDEMDGSFCNDDFSAAV